MYDNIPEELKALPQWCNFDLIDGKKIPYISGEDSMASSSSPRDWRSFRTAVKDVTSSKRHHIGFCFSSSDPFVFIDLDDPTDDEQQQVIARIDTYAQISVSGEGVHLIGRGSFKGNGKHPAYPAAGLFQSGRFCLMTGNVFKSRTTINAVDDNDLQSIHTWLGGGKEVPDYDLTEYLTEIPDQTVFEMGCDHFHKYRDLSNGNWEKYEEYHGDHSTADHALLACLCDLSASNQQVRSLFYMSGMWSSDRWSKKSGHGENGYVDRTIKKIRSAQMRASRAATEVPLEFGPSEEIIPEILVPVAKRVVEAGKTDLLDALPAGLLRELAFYSYSTAYLPLQEASLLVALTVMSSICGRGYLTPSNQGLNLWLVLVGRTGCGKDELQNGVKRVLSGISKQVPHIRRIFGGELTSGPALETTFQDTFRYTAYFKEFGKTFSTLSSMHAQEHSKSLVGALLNSYNSGGINGSIEGRKKAQSTGERPFIHRPCLNILGDSTHTELYGAMSSRELESGFLQRFILLPAPQSSWSLKANPRAERPLPQDLRERLSLLAEQMERFDASPDSKPTVVAQTKEARARLEDFTYQFRVAQMREAEEKREDEIYNRSGLKVYRLATLAAVSADPHSPLISLADVEWAISLVGHADADMVAKFTSGDVGSGQLKQEADIRKACRLLQSLTIEERVQRGMKSRLAKDNKVVPLSLLKKMVTNNPSFSSAAGGAVFAFDKCVEAMTRAGDFNKLSESFADDTYRHRDGILLLINRGAVK